MNYILQIWKSKDLRTKILFTIGIIIIFRILAQISLPGANTESLKLIFQQNQILGMFSLLTGGSAENFSIILMGLSPYINASIIMQLLTVIVPSLENMQKEGEQSRRKINQYTRWITVPIAFLQSYGMIALLNAQSPIPIIENIGQPTVIIPIMLTVATGSILLMWLGELITEKGLGNGVSVLIFAGIVASIPTVLGQNLALVQQSSDRLIPFILGVLITLALTIFVMYITEGVRNIPITYAGRGVRAKGVESSLPLRVNQAGMIPIIFGISVISFPGLMASFFQNSSNETLISVGSFLAAVFNEGHWIYITTYFLLVMAFTYFYVSITFNPEQVAENIQKRGGYIPGIRPGKETAEHLARISNRLNLWGGIFIGFIAISPLILSLVFIALNLGAVPMLLSGAGLIIVVGVVLELLRQVNAQMVMHDYNKLY